MGVLLSDWLAGRAAARGENVADKLVVTTIVSSSMLDALARKHGFELRRTLTGFKYIGEQIARLEEKGEQGRFLFGFEESYGYLSGTYVRDKDAVVASMLICEMARDYKGRGMDLVDAVEALYDELGYYRNRTISLAYPGAEGAEQMRASGGKPSREQLLRAVGREDAGGDGGQQKDRQQRKADAQRENASFPHFAPSRLRFGSIRTQIRSHSRMESTMMQVVTNRMPCISG